MSDALPVETFSRRRYRAPSGSGDILAVPALSECATFAAENARQLALATISICDTPLPELRRQARAELFECVAQLRQRWQLPETPASTGLLFMTGHQPVLAHPGVWIKNACIHHVSQPVGGTAVNLIVDSDLCTRWDASVPGGTLQQPQREAVPFDRSQSAQPWEEVTVADHSILDEFSPRLTAHMQAWGVNSLAAHYWQGLPSAESVQLVALFTQARARQEARWGWRN